MRKTAQEIRATEIMSMRVMTKTLLIKPSITIHDAPHCRSGQLSEQPAPGNQEAMLGMLRFDKNVHYMRSLAEDGRIAPPRRITDILAVAIRANAKPPSRVVLSEVNPVKRVFKCLNMKSTADVQATDELEAFKRKAAHYLEVVALAYFGGMTLFRLLRAARRYMRGYVEGADTVAPRAQPASEGENKPPLAPKPLKRAV
jgi:hypothetical protein